MEYAERPNVLQTDIYGQTQSTQKRKLSHLGTESLFLQCLELVHGTEHACPCGLVLLAVRNAVCYLSDFVHILGLLDCF
jgi:hypothetical protein